MRAARAVPLISANARSATPLYLGLSAGVNSCLIPRLRHSFPKFAAKNSSPLSDLAAITADSVPSARTSVRNGSNALAASDFLPRKYTRVNHVPSSRTISIYHFHPILGMVIFPLRSTNTRCSFLSALVIVDLAMGFRSPYVIEHPRHSWSFPLRLTPCCFTVFLSSTSCVCAVEDVDVNGGGESFCLPRSNYGTSSVCHPTVRLWAVPILAATLSNQGEIYGLPPLQL